MQIIVAETYVYVGQLNFIFSELSLPLIGHIFICFTGFNMGFAENREGPE
jgi:hypothetical protein